MSWDDLNMREKAAMMRVAVRNKIFDIDQIKEQYNKFSEGGYIYSTPEEKALLKANNLVEPASNYSEATDMSISSLREWITDIVQRTIPECPTGLSNCTLTASQFYGKPIGRAATIVSNPEANNFYQVSEDYAVPGTMVIASSPEGTPNPVYHTMILSGYADKDYPFEYNGIHYDIKKGDPLVHYSKGKNSADNYKKNIPLKVYTDQSHGKTLNRYYRPFDENNLPNVLLPELVVLPTNNQAQQNNVNMYEDGGPQNISFYELANDPQYGYHLIDDGKNGQPTYYNANTGQWFLANKAQDEGRLSEIKSGDTFTPIIANPVPEQPSVSNYISSQISNMQRPLTEEQAWDKQLEKAKETFSYFPGIGEAIDVYDAGTEALKGNYEAAVAGLGLMFLPEWAEKGIKKGGKWLQSHASDLYYGLKNKFKKEDNIIWEDGNIPTFDLAFPTKQQSVFKNSLNENKIDLQPNFNEWEEAQNIRKFWQGITMPKYKELQNNIVADAPLYPPGNFYFLEKGNPMIRNGALGYSNGKDAYIYEVDNYDKSIPLDEVVIHEGIHNFRDQFDLPQIIAHNGEVHAILQHNDSKYTEKVKQLLDDAYIFDDDFLSKHPNLVPLAEKGATNTQLQYYLAKKYNAFDKESLNRTIVNLSDDDILYYLWQTNGYGKSFTRQLTDEQKINRALKIREALKGIYKYGGKINNL